MIAYILAGDRVRTPFALHRRASRFDRPEPTPSIRTACVVARCLAFTAICVLVKREASIWPATGMKL